MQKHVLSELLFQLDEVQWRFVFGLTFRILRWNTKVFVFLYWMPLLRFLGACVALAEIYGLSHLNIYNYIRSLIEMGEN